MLQDIQQRQKAVLQSEIRLLEKQKRDLQQELEQLEATQKEAFSQQTKQIKDLTNRKNELSEQVERLRDAMSLLTEAYTKSRDGMEAYVKQRMSDANTEADTVLAGAKRIQSEALSKHDEAVVLQKKLNELQEQLVNESAMLRIREDEVKTIAITLDARKEADQKNHQKMEEELHEMQDVKRSLSHELELLQKTLDETIAEVTTKKQLIATEEQMTKEKHTRADSMTIQLAQKEEYLREREIELKREQRMLDDRRKTLDRAVEEYRARGVKI